MRNLSLIVMVLTNIGGCAGDLAPVRVFGTPVKGRQAAWEGHIDHIAWLDDETLIYAGKSGFVKCQHVDEQTEKWSIRLNSSLRHLTTGRGQIFILDDAGTVHVLAGASGKAVRRLDRDAFAAIMGANFPIPNNIAWVPKHNAVLISTYSDEYGNNSFLLDDQSFKLLDRIKSDGFLKDVIPTPSGSHIAALSNANNTRIWSIEEKREVFRMGDNKIADIDAPFTSHALFDGEKTLVYSIDNSWATGTVRIFDIMQRKDLVQFDSRNGHLEMDVDFTNSRIALTGTNQNLTIVDFNGTVVAERKKVAVQRVVAVKFSPSLNRVAIGSWDNTVRVFDSKIGNSSK